MPSCASQSNAAFRNIPHQWPATLRHMQARATDLLVFRAATAFRCESEDNKSDLTPMQEEVIVGGRCGSLLYKFTKNHPHLITHFNFIFLHQCIHSASKHVK